MNTVRDILKDKLLDTGNDINIVDGIMNFLIEKCKNCDTVCFVEDLDGELCKKCASYADKYINYSKKYRSLLKNSVEMMRKKNQLEQFIVGRGEFCKELIELSVLNVNISLIEKQCEICKNVFEQIQNEHLPYLEKIQDEK